MLFKKLLRTVLKYKAQFISMAIMIALGICVFHGFNIEWYALEKNLDIYYKETNFADYRVYDADNGFSQEELQKVQAIEGVKAATRFSSVSMSVKGTNDLVALSVSENMTVSDFKLIEGEAYDENSTDGMWLSDSYAKANGVGIGDELTLVYKDYSVSGTVKGLIKASEYLICLIDDTQLMPDYNTCGYAYVSPRLLEKVIDDEVERILKENPLYRLAGGTVQREKQKTLNRLYMQINIISDLSKAELSQRLDAALGRTCLLATKDETVSWAEAQGEVEEGKTMGSIMPVLFLAIAVLTMVTTMHRITANEKTQIGTLKALGYRDKRILIHYTSYALFIGLVGTVLGIGLGYLIAWYILRPEGAMGTYIDMPYWTLYAPWFCWAIMVLINVLLVLIGFLSVKRMLKGTAADALRPYTPRRVKHFKIEETKAFKRLSFGTKWNLRDCFRHKARSFMTLFGVVGCVILILGGLGMKDTMNAFIDRFYDNAVNYAVRVNLNTESAYDEEGDSEEARLRFNEEAMALSEKYSGDTCAQFSARINDKGYLIEVYDIKNDKVRFLDDNMQVIPLGDEGVYICARIARDYDLGAGDEISFSPYGSDKTYTVKIAGVCRSLSESVMMTAKFADEHSIPYTISAIYTDETDIEAGSLILSTTTKQAIMDSFDTFMELMNVMVALLVIAAAILGVVVLYNLGIMSYVERYREMATLKVVGFKNKKIGRLLISQNLWLTVLGIIIGIPLGAAVLSYLITALAGEYEMKMTIGIGSYLISTLLTIGVSLVVGLMVAKKNKHIDMVAALKTEE